MKTKLAYLFVLIAVSVSAGERDAARKLADAMAASGSAQLAGGNTEKAKDFFFKALAASADCPEALFGLAKIFDKEGQTMAAGDFYVRASRLMQQEEKPGSPFVVMRAEADRRIQALNPYAPRFAACMDEYAQELGKILTREPDSLTREAALSRAESLRLKLVVPPASMSWAAAAPPKAPDPNGVDAQGTVGADGVRILPFLAYIKWLKSQGMSDNEVVDKMKKNNWDEAHIRMGLYKVKVSDSPAVVPPDVEGWLKKNGWTTITGTWKRKAEGVFEVTDGRLEAVKTNGAIDVIVQKGFTDAVAVFVRNWNNDYAFNYLTARHYTSGYGMVLKGHTCELFAPSGFASGTAISEPRLDREEPLPDGPKNELLLQVQDTALTYILNGRNLKSAGQKISRDGPFVIEVVGTATLEMPRCVGK